MDQKEKMKKKNKKRVKMKTKQKAFFCCWAEKNFRVKRTSDEKNVTINVTCIGMTVWKKWIRFVSLISLEILKKLIDFQQNLRSRKTETETEVEAEVTNNFSLLNCVVKRCERKILNFRSFEIVDSVVLNSYNKQQQKRS